MHDLSLFEGSVQTLHPGRLDEEAGVRTWQGSVETLGYLRARSGKEKIAHHL